MEKQTRMNSKKDNSESGVNEEISEINSKSGLSWGFVAFVAGGVWFYFNKDEIQDLGSFFIIAIPTVIFAILIANYFKNNH